MRVLVFGQTGQVARELARCRPKGVEVTFLAREAADLEDPNACAAAISARQADAVINAAAWTAVDAAEADEATATLVNSDAPGAIARACAKRSLPLLHLSTDYVFDGLGDAPFASGHATAPLSAYGRSKLSGELAVLDSGARALILRTSWVFSSHGSNFVKTMLRLGRERGSLRVVADQIGGPTPASAIADALYTAARTLAAGHSGGTYHFAGTPDTSWADFARAIMTGARLPCRIEDIPSSDYPMPAKRPRNSRLDCAAFSHDFGVARPDWRLGLAAILTDLGVNV